MEQIQKKLSEGDIAAVPALIKEELDKRTPVEDILNKGLIAGMQKIGEEFKENKIFVPEVMLAAKAMQAGMDILEPLLAKAGVEPIGKVAIGTVKGDLHDIGKNLVAMMFKGAGMDILDFGIDVAPEKFVDAAASKGAQIVAMSALLTTSMPSMKQTVAALKEAGLSDKVKTIIGGAPVTQEYADEIGADGYADDAASAVDIAKGLLRR